MCRNLKLVIVLVSMCSAVGVFSIECGDPSTWTPFNDQLCIALLETEFANFSSAIDICGDQAERFYNPTLLRLDSLEIQNFTQSFLYTDNDVVDDVWIGARFSEEKNDFVWLNGSDLDYTNWAPGYPRNVTDVDRCVVIRTPDSRAADQEEEEEEGDAENAKWFDVSCNTHKIVACQKEPEWTNEKIVAQIVKLTEQINSCNCQP